MSTDDVQHTVHEILVDEFELDPGDVHPQALLGEDLELDSLDRVDLIVTLEKATGIRFVEDQVREVRTVADLVAAVERVSRDGARSDRLTPSPATPRGTRSRRN